MKEKSRPNICQFKIVKAENGRGFHTHLIERTSSGLSALKEEQVLYVFYTLLLSNYLHGMNTLKIKREICQLQQQKVMQKEEKECTCYEQFKYIRLLTCFI